MREIFQFGPSSVETIDINGNYTKTVTVRRESDIEKHLVDRVKALGGEVRKVQWVGRRGAPDRLVMLPPRPSVAVDASDLNDLGWWQKRVFERANTTWVELKATGVKPEAHQLREHERMRKMGQRVVVIDSIEGVEELLS